MDKLEFTKSLVLKAKEYILEELNKKINIDTKSSRNDFVTSVDKGVEKLIVDSIREKFPNQDFFTEENTTENKFGNELWIIDPIDGTTNFIFNKQYFAISIAYYENLKPVFGLVYDVMADEMYYGITGKGAYLNGHKLQLLDINRTFPDVMLSAHLPIFKYMNVGPLELNEKIIAHRSLGSAAIELCHIASGKLHIYMARSLNLWDVAAALIILNEVGGAWYFGGEVNKVNLKIKQGVFYGCSNAKIYHELDEMMEV